MAKILVAGEPAFVAHAVPLLAALGHEAVREPSAAPDAALLCTDAPLAGVVGLIATLRTAAATADVPVLLARQRTSGARPEASILEWPFDADEFAAALAQALHPPRPRPEPTSDVRRTVSASFHDVRNLLAALGNYLEVLRSATGARSGPLPAAVDALEDLALRLEGHTDRLRSFLAGVVDGLDGSPSASPKPPRSSQGSPADRPPTNAVGADRPPASPRGSR